MSAPAVAHATPRDEGLVERLDRRLSPFTEQLILAGILALALGVRIAFVHALSANPYFAAPELDQRLFLAWGRDVAAGQLVPDGPFPRAPLYAWWVGAWLHFGHGDLMVVRLVQACAGTLAVFFGWLCARELLPRPTALLAALLHAMAWIVVYYEAELLRESLVPLANFAALWVTLRWWKSASPRHALLAGIAWGLSALLRPQILIVPLAFAAVRSWKTRRVELSIVVLVLATCVPIAPVTLHNLRSGGEFVLISAEGGQALWIANNPVADGVSAVAPGTRRGLAEQEADARAEVERALGHAPTPGEVSRFFAQRAWGWIRTQPAAYLRLLALKCWLLVGNWEHGGNPEEPHFLTQRFASWALWSPVGWAFLLALSAAALATQRRPSGIAQTHATNTGDGLPARIPKSTRAAHPSAADSRRSARAALAPVYLATGVYALTVLAFLVSARHRLPLVPLLTLPAAAGAMNLLDAGARRSWRALAPAALIVCATYALSTLAPAPVSASRANGLAWLGMHAARAGDTRAAMELLSEALRARDDFAYVWAARGASAQRLGDTSLALADFQRAVALDPASIHALQGLAELELRAGRFSDASRHATRAIELAPHLPLGWSIRGRAHYRQQEIAEAVADLKVAVRLDPAAFTAQFSLAAALEELPASDEALHAYEAAARLIPRTPAGASSAPSAEARRATRAALVRLLSRADRVLEAEAWAVQLADEAPQKP